MGLFFPYFKVYIYSRYALESMDYNIIGYIYHNLLKFDDSKFFIISFENY